MSTCLRCGQPTEVDLDEFSILHDHCARLVNQAAADRNERVANGDISVDNPTAEEHIAILEARQKNRNAIAE